MFADFNLSKSPFKGIFQQLVLNEDFAVPLASIVDFQHTTSRFLFKSVLFKPNSGSGLDMKPCPNSIYDLQSHECLLDNNL